MKSNNVFNKKFWVFRPFFSHKFYVVGRKKNNVVKTGCFIITRPTKQRTNDSYTEKDFRIIPK